MRGFARAFALIAAMAAGACASPPPAGDAGDVSEVSGTGGLEDEGGQADERQDDVSLEILARVAAAEVSGRSAGRPEDWNDPRFGDSALSEQDRLGQQAGPQDQAAVQAAGSGGGTLDGNAADSGTALQTEALAAEAAQPDGNALGASESAAEAKRNASEISDEQDFEAVTRRESIESDAQRLKDQQTARIVYAPEPLPERPGQSNIVLFALQTNHFVGEEVYERVAILVLEQGVLRRCREYPDAEAAQQAFLDAGGPEEDELLIDPDGDGFVCGWDPEIYRTLFR